jgi:hypothetical protein
VMIESRLIDEWEIRIVRNKFKVKEISHPI